MSDTVRGEEGVERFMDEEHSRQTPHEIILLKKKKRHSIYPPTNNATFRWITKYVEKIFPNELFLFITEEIKLNTVIVEGGYMSGIPAKNMYKSKFTGCKSIQPPRSVFGRITFCSNYCYKSLWGRSLLVLHSDMVKSLPILHVKIALVLPSLMGIVDGPQSSSLTINC